MNDRSLAARLGALLCLMALAACGGGGGGQTEPPAPSIRTPLANLTQDTLPTGARQDLRDRNYFPLAVGDNWTYDRQTSTGGPTGQTVTRSVTASGGDLLLTESSPSGSDLDTYRRTAEGLLLIKPLGDAVPVGVQRLVGDVVEYPEPFYAVGGERILVRQGEWPQDLDGDGYNESVRFEFRQTLVGFESLALPSGTLTEVAHFRNVGQLTLQGSDPQRPVQVARSTEDAWWAPGIGLVRSERRSVDGNGVTLETPYSLVLTGGRVAGESLFGPKADGTLRKLALVHNALVFDRTRNVYYASIPGSVPVNGNRIASIDPTSGAISYASAAAGSEPAALALSADGKALFVGLDGSGEVVRLRLPDFAELSRTRLPVSSFYGQMLAERISASPLEPDVIAVSLRRTSVSPRHGGVALIRAGVLQPKITQDHTGSNLIAFGGDGRYVYGFNNETTEFGLRRLAVLPDGLSQEQVVTARGDFGTRTLDWSANGLVLGRTLYRAPELTQLGQVNVGNAGCRPHSVANRLVCAQSNGFGGTPGTVAVVDANSFVVLALSKYEATASSNQLSEIVAGPAGQVALRMNALYDTSPADALWLHTAPALR